MYRETNTFDTRVTGGFRRHFKSLQQGLCGSRHCCSSSMLPRTKQKSRWQRPLLLLGPVQKFELISRIFCYIETLLSIKEKMHDPSTKHEVCISTRSLSFIILCATRKICRKLFIECEIEKLGQIIFDFSTANSYIFNTSSCIRVLNYYCKFSNTWNYLPAFF